MARATKVGVIPATTYFIISLENSTSYILMKKSEGSAK
jgi:uncharacterized membrane protein